MTVLKRLPIDEIAPRRSRAIEPAALDFAQRVAAEVRREGSAAVRRHAERFGERGGSDPLVLEGPALRAALDRLDAAERGVLERTASRIEAFARAQRAGLRDVAIEVPGGRAGHEFVPMARAGCYAPGGRYPLPSSVLMTAIPARVAGCADVVVATPDPGDLMLAAAAIAGADVVLAVGGAHGIAALAYGCDELAPCDIVVGPGNRWVTAAKHVVSGDVAIDMLAGPSELVVLADETADPALVAADLLAQAEHDADAVAILVTTDAALADAVDVELAVQLADLPTADVAAAALENGGVAVAPTMDAAIAATNLLAPEHLEILAADPGAIADDIEHAGGLFLGARTAEVFGDYGAGPNHTLPTGGSARSTAGLSVLDFLRPRTWLDLDGGEGFDALAADARDLARLEGLAAHARAAERRQSCAVSR